MVRELHAQPVDYLNLLLSMVTAGCTILISLLALRFQAPPRIQITLECYRKDYQQRFTRRPWFRAQQCFYLIRKRFLRGKPLLIADCLDPGETAILRFKMENVGRIIAKPASTDTVFYVNLDQEFDLHVARFGSNLERCTYEQRFGKGMSRYFKVDGIHLFYDEKPEYVMVRVTAPKQPADYTIRIAAMSKQCDHATFSFRVRVGGSSKSQRPPGAATLSLRGDGHFG